MIDDFIKSIKASLYDRTSSPLFGAFAISWLIWNHRVVITVLSSMEVEEKFAFIDQQLYPEFWGSVGLLVGYPLLTSLLFIFAYPYPARWVYRFWRKRHKELREVRLEIDNETLLTLEESRSIRRRLTDVQEEHEKELRARAEELERVREVLTKTSEERDKAQTEFEKAQSEAEAARAEAERAKLTAQAAGATGSIPTDDELREMLVGGPWRLVFNPKSDNGSKIVTFDPGDSVKQGQNKNEHTWSIDGGKLELRQEDGQVHTRFSYSPGENLWVHTKESDTLSRSKRQYLVRAQYP